MSHTVTPVQSDPLRISARAARAKPSSILSLMARAKALQKAGRDLVLFGAGEPDFPTPRHIRQAVTDAMEQGHTKYTQTPGIPELRDAVAAMTTRRLGVNYAADEVIVTTGAKMALYELFQATLDLGDEVVLFGPYWTSYVEMIGLAGGTAVIVPTRAEDGFRPDPSLLAAALSPRTRLVLLNSPSNPTGACFDRATLEALAVVIATTDALVVSDDIYDRITYDGRAFANLAQLGPEWRARTVIVNGTSKAYSMTGFRIGWAVGPKSIVAAMGKIQDQSTSGPTAFSQYGALAAVTGPQNVVEHMRAEFERRRDHLHAALVAIPGVRCTKPGGAFYAFPDVSELIERTLDGTRVATSAALSEWLLDKADVLVIPGESFGAAGFLRLSFATSQAELDKGVRRLAAAFGRLV